MQFNYGISASKLPASVKYTNITPVFKNGFSNQKDRPIIILSTVSKIFEKLICRQLSNLFYNILSKFQCGFRKDFSTQLCLLLMMQKWKKATGNKKVFRAINIALGRKFYLVPIRFNLRTIFNFVCPFP